jgi:hypothetical protein
MAAVRSRKNIRDGSRPVNVRRESRRAISEWTIARI